MRPRDIIHFVNQVLTEGAGSTQVSQTGVRTAFLKYSTQRRDALFQEWVSNFPHLREMLEIFVIGSKKSVYLHEIEESKIDQLLLKVITQPAVDSDNLYTVAKQFMDGNTSKFQDIVSICASICYRAGCVGLKLSNEHPFIYSHLNEPLISPAIITPSARVRLQPMLFGAYRIEE
jgi:hypothetical protein